MKRLLSGIVIGALGLFAYQRATRPAAPPMSVETAGETPVQTAYEQPVERVGPAVEATSAPSRFHCDGRTRCPQMTSCEEAMFFLKNCPGVEMDGEGDGVPCERQWCGQR